MGRETSVTSAQFRFARCTVPGHLSKMAAPRVLRAVAVASFWLSLWTFAPAFTGSSPTANGRNLRVATEAAMRSTTGKERKYFDIFVTSPNTGMRTRMSVTKEVPLEQIKKDARAAFG